MEFYRKKGVKDLEDSEPTENFIHKFNELCDVMDSHGPKDAVRADNGKLEVRLPHLNINNINANIYQ